MRYAVEPVDLAESAPQGTGVAAIERFGPGSGCEHFTQRLLAVGDSGSGPQCSVESDEILFVLRGGGVLAAGGENTGLWAGAGAFVRAGVAWELEAVDGLELLSVQVHRPDPVDGQPLAVVDLAGQDRLSATGSRQFVLGITPDVGCGSATQFIGFVPPGRAPDHFHRYDEVIYILEGEGALHVGGESAPLAPGSCIHLPSELVHCLENTGSSELQLLGVFRPAGSPAEAYYPDGSPAAYPES